LLISITCIYLALVIQFRNAIKPFVVFATIPYGMVGALIALLLMGQPFSTIHFGFTGVWARPIGISSLTWIDRGPGIFGLWAHTPYRILASE
jgi:hypothetical protein